MRGHHRQAQLQRQRHGGAHAAFVVGPAGTLHFKVEAAGIGVGEPARGLGRCRLLARQQQPADLAARRAR